VCQAGWTLVGTVCYPAVSTASVLSVPGNVVVNQTFAVTLNSVALANKAVRGCVPVQILSWNTSMSWPSSYSMTCYQSWTFNANQSGPHYVTETCSNVPGITFAYTINMNTYMSGNTSMVGTIPTWTQTDSTCSGCAFTFNPGCPGFNSSSALLGTWQNDNGFCYNFSKSVTAGTTILSSNYMLGVLQQMFIPTVPFGAPTNTTTCMNQCLMYLDLPASTLVWFGYSLYCTDGYIYKGTIIPGLSGNGPSSNGNGGIGSSFYVQQNL